MKHTVPDRVAIYHTDAILGLTEDQALSKAHQLQPLGKGRYRVIGPHVKFIYREVIDLFDATPPTSDALKEADALGVRYGRGIGAALLGARIKAEKGARAEYDKAATANVNQRMAEIKKARAKAAKARG